MFFSKNGQAEYNIVIYTNYRLFFTRESKQNKKGESSIEVTFCTLGKSLCSTNFTSESFQQGDFILFLKG